MSVTDIKGKVIAITGASSGIGEATARHLAACGAKLVLGARREDRLAALARETGALHRRTDVRSRDDLHALVALATDHHGRLDALVSNAGIAPISPLAELRVDEWDAMVDVNLKGVLHGIAAALPIFRAQGTGHFVHTSSTSAHRIVPTQAVYAGTKTAVHALSEGLRQESDGAYRVTLISPGYVATELTDAVTDPGVRAQMQQGLAFAIQPDAIARAIAFALEQPEDVDVGEIIVRPTAQG